MTSSDKTLSLLLQSLTLAEYISLFGTVFDKKTRKTTSFKLWPKQAKLCLLMQHSKECCIPKARQLGISELSAEEMVKLATQTPNFLGLVFSKTERDAIEFLETKIRPKIVHRPSLGGTITWPEIAGESQRYIRLSNGSRILCLPASNRAGASTVADMVIFDEAGGIDLQPGVSLSTMYRNVSPTLEKANGLMRMIGTSEPGSYFNQMIREIVDGEKPIDCFFLPASADPSRTEAWFAHTRAKFPSDTDFLSQYPETIDDFFTVREGLIYKHFDDKEGGRHVKDFVPSRMHKIYLGYDHGFAHHAVLLEAYYDSLDDHLYIHRELSWQGVLAENIADDIKEFLYKTNILPYKSVADSAMFAQTGVKGPIEVFKTKGLEIFQKCKKTRAATGLDASAAMLSLRLSNDKITVHPSCTLLRSEFGAWRWDDKGLKPVDANNDAIDALRYIIADLDSPVTLRSPLEEPMPYKRPPLQLRIKQAKSILRKSNSKNFGEGKWMSL